MREPCSGVRTQASTSPWGDLMEIEYRETLLHAASAMRAWCHYLNSASRWRSLTGTEESILHNAGLIAEDIRRVLCGMRPDDQGLRTFIDVERMRHDKESIADKKDCVTAGGGR